MHLRRVSSGLNWKPHFTVCAGFAAASSEVFDPFCGGVSA